LVSQKFDTQGSRVPPAVDTRMKNGTSPTQAAPPNTSGRRLSGSSRCTTSGSNGQCRNVSCSHRWRMTGWSTVNGHTPGSSGAMAQAA